MQRGNGINLDAMIGLSLQKLGVALNPQQRAELVRSLRQTHGDLLQTYPEATGSLTVHVARLIGLRHASLQFHIHPIHLPQRYDLNAGEFRVHVRIEQKGEPPRQAGLRVGGNGTSLHRAFANACLASFKTMYPDLFQDTVIEYIALHHAVRIRAITQLRSPTLGQCLTVGFHNDILPATFLALVDAVQYFHLMRPQS